MIISEQVKAFIFDLDGVITDTAELHYQSWKRLAEEEGLTFNREINEKLRGVSRRKSLEIILDGKGLPEDKIQEMMDRKNNYYQDLIENITQEDLLPGAGDILHKLKDRDYRLALASASKNARTVVKYLQIEDMFTVIADGYSVDKTKPAPDIFLYTADQLGLDPEETVVVEDAEAGIEAALTAGATAVGIGPEERVGKADYRYDCVAGINLEEILGKDGV